MILVLFIWVCICFILGLFIFYFKFRDLNKEDPYIKEIDRIIHPENLYTSIPKN